MFMSTISRLLSAWFAFLLPCYATYKALSSRPLSEPDLHKWSMYWSVIGAFIAFEYVAEWMVSWLPFYWELKTLFLLYLSLPQTQGSTYVYTTYLQPFFSRNEADLDAGLIAMQRNALTFIQGKLSAVWDLFWTRSGGRATQSSTTSSAVPPQLTWILSTDAWRSAMNILKPSSASATANLPNPTSSRQNSNTGPTGSRTPSSHEEGASRMAAPPFPVPQHYEQ